MDENREDGRSATQLRPLSCTRSVLNRAHGSASFSQGETKILAAVYGPKAGTKKNENPEKACIEVVWKPKCGQIGKAEKEYEMILKRTLQNICLLNVHPNTNTSIIIQLLPCAINAACSALLDAGIPLKYLAVSISCCLSENENCLLDPNKLEEERMKALVHLVFRNSIVSVLDEESKQEESGIITSLTHGVMAVNNYFQCLEQGRAAVKPLSDFLRKKLQSKVQSDVSAAS